MLRRAFWGLGAGLVAGLAGTAALAGSITDPGLVGNTQHDEWTTNGLSSAANPGYGGFPWTAPWPGPIASTEGGDAELFRTAGSTESIGGPVPAGGSLYFGGTAAEANVFGGSLAVVDASPVGGVANVVFQIQIGEAFGYDFFDHDLPVLSYNGGSQNLAASYNAITDQIDNGTVQTPAGPQTSFINTHLLQWDLSGIPGITDFTISFSGVQHAQIFGVRLDQSDVFTSLAPVAAVPEPTSVSLFFCGLAAVLYKTRKRR